MAYTISNPQPERRAEGLLYDDLAPGLYSDETALALDDGDLVAISVERHWLPNGAGIGFHGYARWIEANGQTKLAPNGVDVEASFSFTASPELLQEFNADQIATDVAMMMLGEPTTLQHEDGSPALNVAQEVRFNASIREQIRAVRSTASSAIGL